MQSASRGSGVTKRPQCDHTASSLHAGLCGDAHTGDGRCATYRRACRDKAMLPLSPRKLLPSLEISGEDAILTLTELRNLLSLLLGDTSVDEDWYFERYPDVAEGVQKGAIKSAREHYLQFGYLEGRMPHRPQVDEAWYIETYSDVAEAIAKEVYPNAFEHFVREGYHEGRAPAPEGERVFVRRPAPPTADHPGEATKARRRQRTATRDNAA